MELLWYSPTDLEETEIARYSSQILPHVVEFASVLAVEDGRPGGAQYPAWWRQIAESTAAGAWCVPPRGQAPLPIYHIGNNPVHLNIHELSVLEPGIVVLHDISLVDLARCVAHHRGEPDLWLGMMHRQYGDRGRGLARNSNNSEGHYNRMVAEFPLFQPFIEKSLGVIVHSAYARDILAGQLPAGLPVIAQNLPYPPPPPMTPRDYSVGPLRFVFCGHVGPNRRLEEFFTAWGALPAPGRIRLDLFGNVRNISSLQRMARAHGVARYLRFRGYVEDDALDQALSEAHFALNLRWPTMGETSASQLRYWAAGLPTLVTDVGWYGELPDDVVCKVSTSDEAGSMLELLEDIVESPESYQRLGVAGRTYLAEHHNPDIYARELVEFAARCGQSRLAYRMLNGALVDMISGMCESESALDLFRAPVELAVAMYNRSPD